MTNHGLEFSVAVITDESWCRGYKADDSGVEKFYDLAIAVLSFRFSKGPVSYPGLLLADDASRNMYHRVLSREGYATVKVPAYLARLAKPTKICLSDHEVYRVVRTAAMAGTHVLVQSTDFKVVRVLVRGCTWYDEEYSLRLHASVQEEPQEALFKIMHKTDREPCFFLLLSNTVVVSELISPNYSQQEHWKFRQLGMAVVANETGETILRSNLGLAAHSISVGSERKIFHELGNGEVKIVMEEGRVYQDHSWQLRLLTSYRKNKSSRW